MDILGGITGWAVANFLTPIILSLVLGAAAAVVGWIGVLYTRLTGSKLDEKHQRSLQSALENGMKFAIQVILKGRIPLNLDAQTQQRLISSATDYAKSSVPDAMSHFKLLDKKTGETDDYRMERLLLTKLPVVQATVDLKPSEVVTPLPSATLPEPAPVMPAPRPRTRARSRPKAPLLKPLPRKAPRKTK